MGFHAVCLRRKGIFEDSSTVSSKVSGATRHLNPPGSTENKGDLLVKSTEDTEDGSDSDNSSDLAEGLSGFQNILRDRIPGVRLQNKDCMRQDSGAKDLSSFGNKAKLRSQRSIENVMFDLAKFIGREKIPLKVLKDLSEFINLSHSGSESSTTVWFNQLSSH